MSFPAPRSPASATAAAPRRERQRLAAITLGVALVHLAGLLASEVPARWAVSVSESARARSPAPITLALSQAAPTPRPTPATARPPPRETSGALAETPSGQPGPQAPGSEQGSSLQTTIVPDIGEPLLPINELAPPGEMLLRYEAQRGNATGSAELRWHSQDQTSYELSWQVQLSSAGQSKGSSIDWASQGELGQAGLRPLRMVERRRGRDRAAVNFQRDKSLISFSGPRGTLPLPPGVQDRASWMIQLPLLAAAAGPELAEGSGLSLPVATVSGELDWWSFSVLAEENLSQPEGPALRTWLLAKQPARPYDYRIEVWLARDHRLAPVQLRLTQMPGTESLTLTLREGLPPAAPNPSLPASAPAQPAP